MLSDASKWIGSVCVLALLGVAVAALTRQSRCQVATLAMLVTAAVLAPLNQARILTTTSLSKHVDFGAWFAAAAAGYAVGEAVAGGPMGAAQATTAVLALWLAILPIGMIGKVQAGYFFQAWPNTSRVAESCAR